MDPLLPIVAKQGVATDVSKTAIPFDDQKVAVAQSEAVDLLQSNLEPFHNGEIQCPALDVTDGQVWPVETPGRSVRALLNPADDLGNLPERAARPALVGQRDEFVAKV